MSIECHKSSAIFRYKSLSSFSTISSYSVYSIVFFVVHVHSLSLFFLLLCLSAFFSHLDNMMYLRCIDSQYLRLWKSMNINKDLFQVFNFLISTIELESNAHAIFITSHQPHRNRNANEIWNCLVCMMPIILRSVPFINLLNVTWILYRKISSSYLLSCEISLKKMYKLNWVNIVGI